MVLATVKKGKPELRKKVMPAVHSAEEDLQEEGWPVHLFRGQRRGDCEQQGRDEGFCHHRSGSQGVCRPLAQNSLQRFLHCVIAVREPPKPSLVRITTPCRNFRLNTI